MLKNTVNQQWKAAAGLATDRRWVVTGTPVETQISDFHGLLKVLKVCACKFSSGYKCKRDQVTCHRCAL